MLTSALLALCTISISLAEVQHQRRPDSGKVQERDLERNTLDVPKLIQQAVTAASPQKGKNREHGDESSEDTLGQYKKNLKSAKNGYLNKNPDPPTSIYPRRESCDPAYSVPEQKLRSAIYIPKTFTYGNKTPVVLFPGSGSTGYMTFAGSFIPLLTNVTWADPIWVNVPMMLLDDAQSNSEYIAYALNYIAAITNRNVSLIAWSQGNLNAQWANKYWPSTRKITSNNIALSADYKGTTLAALVDATGLTKTPAFIQQESKSRFLRTLRSSGGDSAYVPTTTIYSSNLDEIVVPQKGKQASAYLKDARRVGVTNVEVQAVCHDKPAGGFYTHESILGNPLAFALAKDAIIKGGPAQLKRLNLSKICQRKLTAGLGDDDAKITEMAILKIAEAVLKYSPKAQSEPPIRSYARQGYSQC